MQIVDDFKDYTLLETSNGYKKELWGEYTLVRPDPSIIWEDNLEISDAHAKYTRSNTGGGSWTLLKKMSDIWQVNYKDYTFNLKLMSFKHTGLFPEQAYNWNYIEKVIKDSKRNNVKVLNLFAYTGAASIAALHAGASVVHVDSSRGMIEWAKENVKSSHLDDKPIRFLQDDVVKFVKREIRRGNHYDAIIMDPPSYGRGANGEVWDIEKNLNELVELCTQLLSEKPLFFLINSYTTGLSSTVLNNLLTIHVEKKFHGKITCGEVGIPIKNNDLVLPCGIYGRWEENE